MLAAIGCHLNNCLEVEFPQCNAHPSTFWHLGARSGLQTCVPIACFSWDCSLKSWDPKRRSYILGAWGPKEFLDLEVFQKHIFSRYVFKIFCICFAHKFWHVSCRGKICWVAYAPGQYISETSGVEKEFSHEIHLISHIRISIWEFRSIVMVVTPIIF